MKVHISEFGWKAGFRLCRKRPDLWKITSKRGQSGSDLWKHNLLACLLTVFAVNLVSCGEKEEKKISPLGITKEEYAETAYDLDQIQEAGELIAVTLSGPDTYYEYKGKDSDCNLNWPNTLPCPSVPSSVWKQYAIRRSFSND